MPLPGLIEYLTAQERPGGGGKLTHLLALQYQVARIPAATATVQSLSSIVTSPRANDYAEIGFRITVDRRVNPEVLDASIFQFGSDVVTSFIATDTIEDGVDTWLIITRDMPLRWELDYTSRFDGWFVGTLFYLAVTSLEDLALIRRHVQSYCRGPYWNPGDRYGGLDSAELVGRLDRALDGGRR